MLLECFNAYTDTQITKIFGGKMVHVQYKDGSFKKGIITKFLCAAIADDAERFIVGFALADGIEIVISEALIDNVFIINN